MQPLRLLRRPYRLVKTLPNPLAKKETVWIVSATISNVRIGLDTIFSFIKKKLKKLKKTSKFSKMTNLLPKLLHMIILYTKFLFHFYFTMLT